MATPRFSMTSFSAGTRIHRSVLTEWESKFEIPCTTSTVQSRWTVETSRTFKQQSPSLANQFNVEADWSFVSFYLQNPAVFPLDQTAHHGGGMQKMIA